MIDQEDKREREQELAETICDLLRIDIRFPPPNVGPSLHAARVAAMALGYHDLTGACLDLSIDRGKKLDRRLFVDASVLLAGVAAEGFVVGFREHEVVSRNDRSIAKAWNTIRDCSARERLDRFAEMLQEARWFVTKRWATIETLAGALLDLRNVRAQRVAEIITHRDERGGEWRELFLGGTAHVIRRDRARPRSANVLPFDPAKRKTGT